MLLDVLSFGRPKVTDLGEASIVLSCGGGESEGLGEARRFVFPKVTGLG